MSILSRLRGDKLVRAKIEITHSGSFASIAVGSDRFYGQCVASANGRYTLVWRDGNDEGSHGGARSEGKGRYLLIDGDHVVADGRMERPNDGHVSDNGIFVLNDWRFANELCGTFYAFCPDGTEILHREYLANLYNCGVSRDGRFACCQTCRAPSEHDSPVLTIFDLEKAVDVARWRPESGWARAYEFSADGAHILLTYNEGPPLRYTLSGMFIDRGLWIESRLSRGDLYMVQRLIKETPTTPEGEFACRLIACVDKGLAAVRADDPKTRAFGLKLKAICLDGLEDWTAALAAYEEALALDPKVGVKRRSEQLRNKLVS